MKSYYQRVFNELGEEHIGTMKDSSIHSVFEILEEEVRQLEETAVGKIAKESRSPFKVLISTIISSRTKDEVTKESTENLFEVADNPHDMRNLNKEYIQELIYPAGFYKNKSKYILKTCDLLVENYDGEVPDTIDELVKLMGVGRKTANLVVTLAFDKPGICVDTHVHRITNRWGYINTSTPYETEMKLREKLPKEYWIPINNLLVSYGQNICTPISPYCKKCRLQDYCDQVNVENTR